MHDSGWAISSPRRNHFRGDYRATYVLFRKSARERNDNRERHGLRAERRPGFWRGEGDAALATAALPMAHEFRAALELETLHSEKSLLPGGCSNLNHYDPFCWHHPPDIGGTRTVVLYVGFCRGHSRTPVSTPKFGYSSSGAQRPGSAAATPERSGGVDVGWNLLLGTGFLHRARGDATRGCKDAADVRSEIRHTIGNGAHNHNAERQRFDVLLKLKVSI